MALTLLTINNFRNINFLRCEPLQQGFNLIYGPNGSGKTSILESIYYLSLGRSFRAKLSSRLVRHASKGFVVFAHVSSLTEPTISIGIERPLQGELKIRVAQENLTTLAELAYLTPVQLINSQTFELLEAGPAKRRKYVDWGTFYANKSFLPAWRNYMLALKQRNAALRQGRTKKELDSWTAELIIKAEILNTYRIAYTQKLLPILKSLLQEIISIEGFNLEYLPGWDQHIDYTEVLHSSLARDLQLGHTQYGPHRADLKININNWLAKDILSRGQQKLFICAMILAQGILLQEASNKKPIYLIDDLPAELDKLNQQKLINILAMQKAQIFLTAVEKETISAALKDLPHKTFHVEHGELKVNANIA